MDIRTWSRLHAAGLVSLTLSLALVVPFLVVAGWPAFQDFGGWMYEAFAASWILTGHAAEGMSFATYPVPYALGQAVLTGLNLVMGPMSAGFVYVMLYLALGAAAVDILVRKYDVRPLAGGVFFTLTIVVGSGFWNGYIGSQLGLVLLMFVLGLPRAWIVSPVGVLVCSLLMFASHGIAYAVYCVVGLGLAWRAKRVLAYAMGILPSIGLAVWYSLASFKQAESGGVSRSGLLSHLFYKGYTATKLGAYGNLQVGTAGDGDAMPVLYWLGVAANFSLALLLVLLVGSIVRNRKKIWTDQPAELIITGSLILVYLLLPLQVGVLVNPGERVLSAATVFIGVLTMGRTNGDTRRLSALAAGALVAGAGLTLVSALTMGIKQGLQIDRPTIPGRDDSRIAILYGHRTDADAESATNATSGAATGAGPQLPPRWGTSFLLPTGGQ